MRSPRSRAVLGLLAVLPLGAVIGPIVAGAPAGDDERPLSEQGYAGLALRDIPGGHTVVSWIFPGPLDGRGLTSSTLVRPDLIVDVDGRTLDAEGFRDYVRDRAPGERITIRYRRSRRPGGTIPETLDHDETVQSLSVTLVDRAGWIGTVGRARGHARAVTWSSPPMLDASDPENVLGRAVQDHDLGPPLATLLEVFRERLEKDEDHHALSRVRAVFEEPLRLPELADRVTEGAAGVRVSPLDAVVPWAAGQLDLDVPPRRPRVPTAETAETLAARMELQLAAADALAEPALAGLASDAEFARRALGLLAVPRNDFYLTGREAIPSIDVIRASTTVDFAALLAAWTTLIDAAASVRAPEGKLEAIVPPAWLAGAVEGGIAAAARSEEGRVVVIGGSGTNRYDLARIDVVIDVGGDDAYRCATLRTGSTLVVDLGGDDVYSGGPEVGPGGALLGVTVLDDRGGNDRYEGGFLAAGAAMFGFSLLLDRGGSDAYHGTDWSIGAACYGGGVLVDLGGAGDVYVGEFLCQGVGGPRGFGAIVDDGGRDLYRTNGPAPSAYGTPAVYRSFGQGMGFGYRHYAAGGIGVIADLAGDDRYEAGEFAQGGAYYHGLGVLHDASGNDLYYGNRYGQGFGVHQAGGALVDGGGDDTYWSMTAASQGAAWDIGAGLLLDRGGDDTYRCDGLGQGGAAMQGIALLVDLAGADHYTASGGATQGESGGNTYHFHETGAHSFSVLLDRGAGDDRYSRGRRNGAVTVTGAANPDDPARSSLHGLVIDE